MADEQKRSPSSPDADDGYTEITCVSGEKQRISTAELGRLRRSGELRKIQRSSGETQWGTRDEIRLLERERATRREHSLEIRRRTSFLILGVLLLVGGILLSREGLRRAQADVEPDLPVPRAEIPASPPTDVLTKPTSEPRVTSDTPAASAPAHPNPPASAVPPVVTTTLSTSPDLPLQRFDVRPPRIEWIEAPATLLGSDSVRFSFRSTNEVALFAFFLEGLEETYSDYVDTNVKNYSKLSDGHYTFYLKAKDQAGNVVRQPLTHTFTIDTHAPHAQITAGPTGTIAERTMTFRFDVAEQAEFATQLVGYESSFSPFQQGEMRVFYDLPDGHYTFLVKARDVAGNEQAVPSERSFVVDTTTPNARLTSKPEPIATTNRVEFQFVANKQALFAHYLTGAESRFSSFSDQNWVEYTDLADGEYTFFVKARDAAGNEDPAPASFSFRVDTQPPTVLITRGPRGTVPYSNITFSYQANEPSVFSYYLEGYEPGFSDFTSEPSRIYHNLPDGTYTFHVRTRDTAGHLSREAASQMFTVHTTESLYAEEFEDPRQPLLAGDQERRGHASFWGYSTARVHNGKYSLWCAGSGKVGPRYSKNMNAWFQVPVDLSYYSQASLTFWYYLDTSEDLADQFVLSVADTSPGSHPRFEIFWKPTIDPQQPPQWQKQTVALTPYAGKPVLLRFYFVSDDKVEDEGVYIDSIELTGKY